MSALPGLTGENLDIVVGILRTYLPAQAKVLVFGSRARTRCKPYSDLDLAIDLGEALPLSLRAELAEALTESDLPWKVDLVDRHTVNEDFARIIDETGAALDW